MRRRTSIFHLVFLEDLFIPSSHKIEPNAKTITTTTSPHSYNIGPLHKNSIKNHGKVSNDKTMKAFAVSEYKHVGDMLALCQVEIPHPTPPTGRDLLIKVKAVAANPMQVSKLLAEGVLGTRRDGSESLKENLPLALEKQASGKAVGRLLCSLKSSRRCSRSPDCPT